ncbi:hypothetical protein [Massilia orientalis]|uniref:Uncharacterized protein n=1 Tax=Massilia orientalis TaxID=3050128 RepID=A0ACC7MG35_9BURK|nr:hypothetical protein [Massilia sp. YIM B02787]
MKAFAHLPVTAQDKPILEDIAKLCCARMRKAAGLGKDFAPFHRNQLDFVARGIGRSSAGALFASAPPTIPSIEGMFTREDVRNLFKQALEQGVTALAPREMEKLTSKQLKQILDALPAIVQSADEKLKALAVDRITFERAVLDPLLAKHVPPFEYTILRDRTKVFVMERAREQMRPRAASNSVDELQTLASEEILAVVRASFYPLVDVVTGMNFPLTHKTIVFADEEGNLVGAGFQHPDHDGVVPVCCESVERFAAVWAALSLPGQAHMSSVSSDIADNPNYAQPFRTGFSHHEREDGPAAYFAQVEPKQAIEYLKALEKAYEPARIKCTENAIRTLRGATLSWDDIYTPRKGTRRRWGLRSVAPAAGATFIMSASGTLASGIQGDSQWYLRQDVWIDEGDVPELGVPLAYPVAPEPYDNEATKIIPVSARTFYHRARAHVDRMPEPKKSSASVRAALKRIKDQDNRLREIQAAIEKDAEARRNAVSPSLTRFGFAGAVCPVPVDG